MSAALLNPTLTSHRTSPHRYLDYNDLIGTVPTQLGLLTNLEHM